MRTSRFPRQSNASAVPVMHLPPDQYRESEQMVRTMFHKVLSWNAVGGEGNIEREAVVLTVLAGSSSNTTCCDAFSC